jgi:hypothetical protein
MVGKEEEGKDSVREGREYDHFSPESHLAVI